ncbi:semaphorin-3D [Aulostomus maculatus]
MSQTGPHLLMSHSELRNGSAVFWEGGGSSGDYQVLLLDEDQGWLLVGGKDHIHLLRSGRLDLPARSIHWPAPQQNVEHCILAGKHLETECANYVRLLQPINKTCVYACGTSAFSPQCVHLHVDAQGSIVMLPHTVESGRGRCPFSHGEPFTTSLTDGELYAGISVDFMGANAGIFRTTIQGGGHHYIRTEAYDRNWLNEPQFVGSFSVPDTHSPDDDKVYIFFKETAVEVEPRDKKFYSRVARVCKNDVGGRRSLINRWTTFLKARLVCSVPGPSGTDTHFDELEDIFVLETKDPQNPAIYGVFRTSSSVFRGSAVCIFTMASIRAAFNGPFAHKQGPNYHWVEFKGRTPYPRPGACPSETYDALHKSTKDFPDEVVSFMRQHQLMWDPVLPLGGRPVLTRVNVSSMFKKVIVDRVEAEDGPYDVLHLGTDDGKVVKAVLLVRDVWRTEATLLEELTVFQGSAPVLSMVLSTKKQLLYVSSEHGVAQLGLQRCKFYGSNCVECYLARDPYCSWDGETCSGSLTSSMRRVQKQDIKFGDPLSQCPVTDNVSKSVDEKLVYGMEGNSTFLECVTHSLHAEIHWTMQQQQQLPDEQLHQHKLVGQQDSDRWLPVTGGLLLQCLQLADAGIYSCTRHDHSYSRVLARYRLHVIPQQSLYATGYQSQARANPPLPPQGYRNSWSPLRTYKDLTMAGTNHLSMEKYCEQLWYRKKRHQAKQKQESRKARMRRNKAPDLDM